MSDTSRVRLNIKDGAQLSWSLSLHNLRRQSVLLMTQLETVNRGEC